VYCINCGKQLDTNTNFCPKCGSKQNSQVNEIQKNLADINTRQLIKHEGANIKELILRRLLILIICIPIIVLGILLFFYLQFYK
jgi:Predicted membrane protein